MPAAVWDRAVNPALGYRYSSAEGLAYRVRRFAAYLAYERNAAYAQTMSVWRNPEQLLGFLSKHPLGADATHYPDLTWAEKMMLIDQGNYLQDDILTKVDQASMAVSLEARVPLLTHTLVDWSWQISPLLKIADKGDRIKLVLRELLYRHVPNALVERPK